MNHYLATYIDFVQSLGFISIFVLVIYVLRKLSLNNMRGNYIEAVKVRVDE